MTFSDEESFGDSRTGLDEGRGLSLGERYSVQYSVLTSGIRTHHRSIIDSTLAPLARSNEEAFILSSFH